MVCSALLCFDVHNQITQDCQKQCAICIIVLDSQGRWGRLWRIQGKVFDLSLDKCQIQATITIRL